MLKRRKEIYESKHPETKAKVAGAYGSNRAQGKDSDASEMISFASDTAAKTGLMLRTIQEVQIVTNIDEEVKEQIKQTPIADHKTALLELTRMRANGPWWQPRLPI